MFIIYSRYDDAIGTLSGKYLTRYTFVKTVLAKNTCSVYGSQLLLLCDDLVIFKRIEVEQQAIDIMPSSGPLNYLPLFGLPLIFLVFQTVRHTY